MDFDQPFAAEDLDDRERALDHSSALSDPAYKPELDHAQAVYRDTLAQARRDYEHELNALDSRRRQGHER